MPANVEDINFRFSKPITADLVGHLADYVLNAFAGTEAAEDKDVFLGRKYGSDGKLVEASLPPAIVSTENFVTKGVIKYLHGIYVVAVSGQLSHPLSSLSLPDPPLLSYIIIFATSPPLPSLPLPSSSVCADTIMS